MVEELATKVLDSIRRYGLLDPGDRIICAVSGGPDSTCMVHILVELAERLDITMILAHVNYHTRGDDSDLDEGSCRRLAERFDLPVFTESVNPAELFSMRSGNFQKEAREFRYAFFNRLCSDLNADKISVGHTADDVAETALMHLIRGCGISGLGGIYPKAGNTIRPMIDCSREEIISCLHEGDIEYRVDESNLGIDYFRNQVRNDLMPYLELKYSAQMRQALTRIAKIARAADEFITDAVVALWKRAARFSRMGKVLIDIDKYNEADRIVRYGLIRKAHQQIASPRLSDKSLDYELVENADSLVDQDVGTRADLSSGSMIERGHCELIVFRPEEFVFERELKLPGSYDLGRFGLVISGEIEDIGDERFWDPSNLTVWVDCDRASPPYAVRTVAEGDRVRLLNFPGTKKLSDVLVDKKVPRSLRGEIAVVTAAGEIIWVVGVGIADAAKITDQTRRVLKLSAWPSVIQVGDE